MEYLRPDRLLTYCLALLLTSCETVPLPPYTTGEFNVSLAFLPSDIDVTRGDATTYYDRLNVMLFTADGSRAFDQVKSQTVGDEHYGTLSLRLAEGTYTIVAVGHSSARSATLSSPDMVQFTASNGKKLTDTFCHYSTLDIGGSYTRHELPMYRACAMVRFKLTDVDIPEAFNGLIIEYSGGSANFNPATLEGTTRSTQSERRERSESGIYQCFTFPYQSTSGTLMMTITAEDTEGNIICQRTFASVPVTRNRITTLTGQLFVDVGEWSVVQQDFTFTVHGDWDGEDIVPF